MRHDINNRIYNQCESGAWLKKSVNDFLIGRSLLSGLKGVCVRVSGMEEPSRDHHRPVTHRWVDASLRSLISLILSRCNQVRRSPAINYIHLANLICELINVCGELHQKIVCSVMKWTGSESGCCSLYESVVFFLPVSKPTVRRKWAGGQWENARAEINGKGIFLTSRLPFVEWVPPV